MRRTWGEQNTEAEAIEQLNYSVHEAGVNFIDTAEMYPVTVAVNLGVNCRISTLRAENT